LKRKFEELNNEQEPGSKDRLEVVRRPSPRLKRSSFKREDKLVASRAYSMDLASISMQPASTPAQLADNSWCVPQVAEELTFGCVQCAERSNVNVIAEEAQDFDDEDAIEETSTPSQTHKHRSQDQDKSRKDQDTSRIDQETSHKKLSLLPLDVLEKVRSQLWCGKMFKTYSAANTHAHRSTATEARPLKHASDRVIRCPWYESTGCEKTFDKDSQVQIISKYIPWTQHHHSHAAEAVAGGTPMSIS
jgi:hypothetical protein